jgi:hypothetical protein
MKNHNSIKPSRQTDKTKKTQRPGTSKFWEIDDKGKIKINPLEFIELLESFGFHAYRVGQSCEYIRIKNNIVQSVTPKDMRDVVRLYLIDLGERDVLAQIVKASNLYFGVGVLQFFKTIDLNLLKDTRDKAYFVYKNCAVVISKLGVDILSHQAIDKHIWEDQITNRDIEKCKDGMGGDFAQFVLNTVDSNPADFLANRKALGYLLHNYHDPTNPKAIIINDSDININQPKGGRGKGLYLKAISKLRTTTIEDGKIWTPYKNFAYQKVKQSTQVFILEDLSKGFDFESLFAILTDGVGVERKNRDAFTIEAKDSPKVAITTNYGVEGHGGSFDRRMHNIVLGGHYHCDHRPIDDFGTIFFDGWDSSQWMKFDNFMLDCVTQYLRSGLGESSKLIKKKVLVENMNEALWDYLEMNVANIATATTYRTNDVLAIINDYDSTLESMRGKTLYDSLRKYCKFKKFGFEKIRDAKGRGFKITPATNAATNAASKDGSNQYDDVPF